MGQTIIIIAAAAGAVIIAAVLLSKRGKRKDNIYYAPIAKSERGAPPDAGSANSGKFAQNDRKLLELIGDLADMYKKIGR